MLGYYYIALLNPYILNVELTNNLSDYDLVCYLSGLDANSYPYFLQLQGLSKRVQRFLSPTSGSNKLFDELGLIKKNGNYLLVSHQGEIPTYLVCWLLNHPDKFKGDDLAFDNYLKNMCGLTSSTFTTLLEDMHRNLQYECIQYCNACITYSGNRWYQSLLDFCHTKPQALYLQNIATELGIKSIV